MDDFDIEVDGDFSKSWNKMMDSAMIKMMNDPNEIQNAFDITWWKNLDCE